MRSVVGNVFLGLSAVFAVAHPSAAQEPNGPRQPVARVGEETIYEEEVLSLIRPQLLQIENQKYELKRSALEKLLTQRLLQAEAKSKGLSTEEFLEQTVDRRVAAPAENEVEAYYLAQKDRLNRPLDDLKPELQDALAEARRQQARQQYLEALRKRSHVSILLVRPRVEVTADTTRVRGNPQAPITIVEFSDFQCPHCRDAQKTVSDILEKYRHKVRIAYRDFPLRQAHPQAQQAAEASRCAAEQGKFWEYHDLLFANQSKLDEFALAEHAGKAGLDVERFSGCLGSGKFKTAVDEDVQAGMTAGVSGTPAFFINGVLVTGAQPVSTFEKIIESEIEESVSKSER
jgi:protein-disulfide isomerase